MDINAIIRKIDEFLEKTGKKSTDPVEANAMLEKVGLLRDSDTRPGKPLRDILRAGKIKHAYQTGGKGSSWVIPHSGKSVIQKNIEKPKQSGQPENPIKNNIEKEPTGPNLFDNILKLQNAGFEGFLPISVLLNNTAKIPAQKGVYLVIYNSLKEPQFKEKGSGGFFKGKDPNVPESELKLNWVDGSKVIYIGKAGSSDSSATLISRLTQYLRFGNGEAIGHYGGRYIWQIENPGALLFCWKPVTAKEPRDEEARLIKIFFAEFGRRPFANLKD
jgi:hypothetical protein